MALRAVIDHPKFARLKAALRVPKYTALGMLECLWHFTGKFTPDGRIGKYSVEEIEAWLEWEGEEGFLVAALIKSGWLDVDETHGLIVHDWHKHADEASKLALKRAGLEFVKPTSSPQCRDSVATALRLPGSGSGSGAELPKPSKQLQTKQACGAAPKISAQSPPVGWDEFRAGYPKRDGDYGVAEARKRFGVMTTKEGIQVQDLLRAVRNYADHCDRRGITGTEKVKQIPTFLSKTGQAWREYLDLPAKSEPEVDRASLAFREALGVKNAG